MPREKNQHGQYFTPAGVAKLMISLISAPPSASILEPCAGEGVFLDELDRAGFLDFTAVEIDRVVGPCTADHLFPGGRQTALTS
jgi:hypothetical protein